MQPLFCSDYKSLGVGDHLERIRMFVVDHMPDVRHVRVAPILEMTWKRTNG